MTKHLPLLLATLSIAGCVMNTTSTPQQASAGTTIEHDKYKGLIYVSGPALGATMLGGSQSWQIVTSLDGNGAIVASWIDYVESVDASHTLYASAQDALSKPLRVEKLNLEHGTRYDYPVEEVAVDLPEGYLREHLHEGIDIELQGRRGSQILKFGSGYIAGYWSKLLIAQACVKAGSC
jgi:hypothetical protein